MTRVLVIDDHPIVLQGCHQLLATEEFLKAFLKVREGKPYLSHELASDVAFRQARERRTP